MYLQLYPTNKDIQSLPHKHDKFETYQIVFEVRMKKQIVTQ